MPEYPVTVQMFKILEQKVVDLAATVAQLAGVVNELHTKAAPVPAPKKDDAPTLTVRKWYDI